jgi:hypothetical protein
MAASGVGFLSPAAAVSEWPSDDLLSEQSYLVGRGVRPLAHVQDLSAEPEQVRRAARRLDRFADPGAIAFVVEHNDGSVSLGYAKAGWAVDLYRWTMNAQIPQGSRSQIIGLLLGYSADEIGRYCDRDADRRYAPVTFADHAEERV